MLRGLKITCSVHKRYLDGTNMAIRATLPGMRYENKRLYVDKNATQKTYQREKCK